MNVTIVFKEDNGNIYTFPVTPSEIKIATQHGNQSYNLHNLGEVNLPGKSKLSTFTFSSFFPNQLYPFANNNKIYPYESVDYISSLRDKALPFRVLVTETNINDKFMIDSFEYGLNDGTGDVYFTITLKQYKEIGIYTTKGTSLNKPQVTGNNSRSTSTKPTPPKTHTVKKGDTLSSISKQYYGTTENSKSLYEINKKHIHDPSCLHPGQMIEMIK